MGFRNPVTSLSASAITDGAFSGAFSIPGLFTVGNAGGPRVELGTNGAGKTGLRLYGADGTSVLIDLDTGSGSGVITGQMLRTAATGRRVEVSPTGELLRLYSGDTNQTVPGSLSSAGVIVGGDQLGLAGQTRLRGPGYAGADIQPADLLLEQQTNGRSEAWLRTHAQQGGPSHITLQADRDPAGIGPRSIDLNAADGVYANGQRVDYAPRQGGSGGVGVTSAGGPWSFVRVFAGPFPVPGRLLIVATWLGDKQVASDDFDIYLANGDLPIANALVMGSTGGAAIRVSGTLTTTLDLGAGVSYEIALRAVQRIGTGALTVYADSRNNNIHYYWVPGG